EQDDTCLPPIQQFVLSLQKINPEKEIIVIAFQYPFTDKKYLWNGIEVIPLGGKNRGGFFRLLTWIEAIKVLTETGRRLKVRGLISLWISECTLIGKLYSQWRKVPHLVWSQGQDAKKENKFVRRCRV